MGQYTPIHRPGEKVTFSVTADVTGGQLVQVGAVDNSVAPAAADSTSVVGVAGHDAKVGEKLTTELGKFVHELKASGAIARGTRVEAGPAGTVRALTADSVAYGLAITTAADGAPVRVIQF